MAASAIELLFNVCHVSMVPPQADALRSEYGIVLCVLGVANSRSMLLQKLLPVDASTWQDELSLRVRALRLQGA